VTNVRFLDQGVLQPYTDEIADSPLPEVHPTRPAERVLWHAKMALRRTGAEELARVAVMRGARLTYQWTIHALPRREELPELLNRRGLVGEGAEIGVARGTFSEHLLEHWKGRRLYSIDPWAEFAPGEYVDACDIDQGSMDESFALTERRLARFGDRSAIRRETGQAAAAGFAPGTLDFVYIDARHNYEAVLEDLADWFPLVRSGGILAGHDYNDGDFAQGTHGVRRAVDEFFGARGLTPAHTYTDVPSISWLVEKP